MDKESKMKHILEKSRNKECSFCRIKGEFIIRNSFDNFGLICNRCGVGYDVNILEDDILLLNIRAIYE